MNGGEHGFLCDHWMTSRYVASNIMQSIFSSAVRREEASGAEKNVYAAPVG
jgi:hypothetical protein